MTKATIIREPDDPLAIRISLGRPLKSDDFYLVFRGDPEKVVKLLENALNVAKEDLLAKNYKDQQGVRW